MSELDLLRGLGDQLAPPPLDLLRETARQRNRRTATATMVATAVVVVGLTAALVGIGDGDTASRPIQPVGPAVDDTRPLTYADGATLHLGDEVVSMPAPVIEIDLTDAGAVVRTDDDSIWFTDGSRLERLGERGEPAAAYDGERPLFTSAGAVFSGNTGSLAAWLEFPTPTEPVLVVYDTTAREPVVDRQALTIRGDSWELLDSVTEEAAYWFLDPSVDDQVPSARLDLETGDQSRTTRAQFEAERPAKGSPRTLTTNDDGTWPFVVIDGIQQQFGNDGGRFTPTGGGDFREWDGLTHEPVAYDAPPGYQDVLLFLTQWIDDDTVVLRATVEDGYALLVCRNSTHACETAVTGPGSMVVPDLS